MAEESIRVKCDKCGKILKAPASAEGKRAPCPNCKNMLTIEATLEPTLEVIHEPQPQPGQAQQGPWMRNDTPRKGKGQQVLGCSMIFVSVILMSAGLAFENWTIGGIGMGGCLFGTVVSIVGRIRNWWHWK